MARRSAGLRTVLLAAAWLAVVLRLAVPPGFMPAPGSAAWLFSLAICTADAAAHDRPDQPQQPGDPPGAPEPRDCVFALCIAAAPPLPAVTPESPRAALALRPGAPAARRVPTGPPADYQARAPPAATDMIRSA